MYLAFRDVFADNLWCCIIFCTILGGEIMKWIKCSNELPNREHEPDGDYSVIVWFSDYDSWDIAHYQDYFDPMTAGLDEEGNQKYCFRYERMKVSHWSYIDSPIDSK